VVADEVKVDRTGDKYDGRQVFVDQIDYVQDEKVVLADFSPKCLRR
jgi:hypothetical protein